MGYENAGFRNSPFFRARQAPEARGDILSPMKPRRASAVPLALVIGVLAAVSVSAQFTSYPRGSHAILEGNWQSCREADGRYSERVYDHVVNGVPRFEVHMGPRREFAIFEGVQDEHRGTIRRRTS